MDFRLPLAFSLIAGPLASALLLSGPATAAEQVVFVSGAFRRSIPVAEFEHLAKTGKATGMLATVLRLGKQNPETISKLLNQKINLPVVITSRLINTRIGEAVLNKAATIVYPLGAPSVAVPALRAATILGLVKGTDSSLSAVSFLKAYPTTEMAVNLPALMATVNKASSIADLVRFFSESPLDGLSGSTDKTSP